MIKHVTELCVTVASVARSRYNHAKYSTVQQKTSRLRQRQRVVARLKAASGDEDVVGKTIK